MNPFIKEKKNSIIWPDINCSKSSAKCYKKLLKNPHYKLLSSIFLVLWQCLQCLIIGMICLKKPKQKWVKFHFSNLQKSIQILMTCLMTSNCLPCLTHFYLTVVNMDKLICTLVWFYIYSLDVEYPNRHFSICICHKNHESCLYICICVHWILIKKIPFLCSPNFH